MLGAPSVEQILNRTEMAGFDEARPGSDRLVSILFANPTSPVWSELRNNRGFLDSRSGQEWDLFFAGMSAFGPSDKSAKVVKKSGTPRYFNPDSFGEIESWVRSGQQTSPPQHPWRYSGGTDIVSFMAYGREPDWASTKAAMLYGDVPDKDLLHVTEGLVEWKDENVDPLLAPGQALAGISPTSLTVVSALGWSASVVASGVVGNAAYDLLKQLFGDW